MRICVLKFIYFIISVARRSTQLSGQQHANISTLFQFNSQIVVENCAVGICNNGMFLEFREFETKYLAGVYKRHRTTIYVEYMLNYIVRAGDCACQMIS